MEMDIKKFLELWNVSFPNSYPINYKLKNLFPDRWFRIHSLPNAKRFAKTAEEVKEVKNRQNKLIDGLIGNNKQYFFLISSYEAVPKFPTGYDELIKISDFVQLESLPLHEIFPEEYDEPIYLCLAVKQKIWVKNSLDKVLISVSRDEVENVLLIDFDNSCVICPYDGGMDLILKNETMRDLYSRKYSHWISTRSDGL